MFISLNPRPRRKRRTSSPKMEGPERMVLRPQVKNFMTPTPRSVGSQQTLEVAHELMRRYGVRHLPVLDAGKLVGVVSQRDLYFVESLLDSKPEDTLVGEAMSADVFRVEPETPLDWVAHQMNRTKIGCAVVMKGERLLGVFTTIDALAALAHYLPR